MNSHLDKRLCRPCHSLVRLNKVFCALSWPCTLRWNQPSGFSLWCNWPNSLPPTDFARVCCFGTSYAENWNYGLSRWGVSQWERRWNRCWAMGQGTSTWVGLNSLTIEADRSFGGNSKGFRNTLAGLFCASFGIVKRTTNDIACAVVPSWGYATRLGLTPSSSTCVSTVV